MKTLTTQQIIIIVVILIGIVFVLIYGAGGGTSGITPNGEGTEEASSDDTNTASGDTDNTTQKQAAPKQSGGSGTSSKTTTPLPQGSSLTIVTYTDSGFLPSIIEVRQGKSATFVNQSSKPMRIVPTANSEGIDYKEFSMSESMPTGGTFTFTFLKTGAWGYKNLNFNNHTGAIIVIPQNQ